MSGKKNESRLQRMQTEDVLIWLYSKVNKERKLDMLVLDLHVAAGSGWGDA